MTIDLRHESIPDSTDDGPQFVCEGREPGGTEYLQIGPVVILLTTEQLKAVRSYFENT